MKYLKLVLICLVSLLLVSCGDDDGSGEGGDGSSDYYLTYKLTEQCSTGRQTLRANSETDMANLFCGAMKDHSKNNSCAEYHRKKIFEEYCSEMTWPYKSTPTSGRMFRMDYTYRTNKCGTGWHMFSGTSEAKVMKDYCVKIMDDSFNRNCARSERYARYMELNCDVFMRKPVDNF
jgi:hypothetical protein